jgi:O-antigen/teichoic acid export membrane protein
MSDDAESETSSPLQSIIRGAGANMSGMLTMRALGFVTTYLLTTGLGPTLYGLYSFGKVLINICETIANFGTDQSIIRFVPDLDDDSTAQNRVIGLSILTSIVGASALAVALYFAAPLIADYTDKQAGLIRVLQLFAITLPITTVLGCIASVFRSQEQAGLQVISNGISSYAFRIVTLSGAIALGATLFNVVVAEVIAALLTITFATWLFVRMTDFSPSLSGSRPSLKKFYNYSIPLTMSDTGRLIQNRVDILMVGFFLPGSAIGIYNLSTILAQLITLPSNGLNTIYPPIAAKMYGNGNIEELDALFTQVNRWSFTFSLLAAVGLVFYSSELLSIFGSGFSSGAAVLSLFVISFFANAATGPTGYTLMMTDHQYLMLTNRWGAGIVNAILNYFFITSFGLIGAASATLTVSIISNIVYVAEIWYTEGLFPYSLNFLKPVVAGVACAGALTGWGYVSPVSGIPLLIGGGIVGTAAFALVLFLLGIEPEDREFFEETVL